MPLSLLLVITLLTMPNALVLQAGEHNDTHDSPSALVVNIPMYMPEDILKYYNDSEAQHFRNSLVAGAKKGAKPAQAFDYAHCHRSDTQDAGKKCLDSGKESVFEAAKVSFSLPNMYLSAPNGTGDGRKNTVKMSRGVKCVVYGIGLAEDTGFEDMMTENGCEVHGFDCTVGSAYKNKKWHFHNWCIGDKGDATYSNSTYTDGKNLLFKSLDQTVKELGHTKIDLLKMDIEGFEYGVIENEILKGDKLPVQIAFELHTEEASNRFVPEENTKGKGYNEVSELFLNLFDKGYRVISKQVNKWDKACAEFVVLNVETLQK